jgi:mono/diheme cytochrome c family protein
MKKLALVVLLSISIYACKDKKEDTPTPTNVCNTDGVTYNTTIQPILAVNCFICHGASGPANLQDITTLQELAANGKLFKVITHADGVPAMPKNQPKLSDCDIAKIKAWIDAGAPNN